MKKLMMVALVCCLVLAGCGSESTEKTEQEFSGENKNLGETEEAREFHLDEGELEGDGYEKISDIAFVKIEDEGIRPKVYIKYLCEEPEISFYFASIVMREFHSECDIILGWNGKEYPLYGEAIKGLTDDTFYKAFPEEWEEVINEMQSGNRIDNLITKGNADIIDKSVEEFVSEYKKEKENSQEKEEAENESGESEEERETLAYKSYNYDDGSKMQISFSVDENGEYYFSIILYIEEKWKAAHVFSILNQAIQTDEMKAINASVMLACGDDLLSSYSLSWSSGGDLINTTEWLMDGLADENMDTEEAEELTDLITKDIVDFIESE